MSTILQINASLFGDDGTSHQLADSFVSRWLEQEPDTRVIRRDISEKPIPHLTAEAFQAASTPTEQRSQEQVQEAALADELIEELLAADVLVFGVPTYNFHIPSTLKAWFDYVARAGTTFRYTEDGSEGLLTGKKAYVFTASGGKYSGTGNDFRTPYIKFFLSFLGIDDVTFTHAEGLAMGEETSRMAVEAANRRITELVA